VKDVCWTSENFLSLRVAEKEECVMRAKLLTALIVGAVASTIISISAVGQPVRPIVPVATGRYMCPMPSQINCVPAAATIGPWQANGGQMTGNTFGPNNQCANVITLTPAKQRLLCCYTKCGVFIQDVPAKHCTKLNESTFSCQ
jgi:hypothetical protein